MFEYMSAGIPVIASDFPRWRRIIEETGAGVVVDPADPAAVARCIEAIIADPAAGAVMGGKGRTAVELHYNWESEFEKLAALYSTLVSERA